MDHPSQPFNDIIDSVPEELRACPGYDIVEGLKSVKVAFRAFDQNCAELLRFLDSLEAPGQLVRLDIQEYSEAFPEVNRLLGNFLAAAMALVDITRNTMNRLFQDKDPLYKEYEQEKEHRFAQNPVHCFVQDLRNYCLHYALPLVGPHIIIENIEIQYSAKISKARYTYDVKCTVVVDVEDLLKWQNWRAESKSFLGKHSGELPLRGLVANYYAQVKTFHDWLSEWHQEVKGTELEEFERCREQLSAKYAKRLNLRQSKSVDTRRT